MTIVDSVFRALAHAVPGGTIAGHHADIGVSTMYGGDPATGRLFFFNAGAQGGGWGATARRDGENATICINDGDTHNTPIEASEAKYPAVLVERYALRPDSGGPGRHRGGLGTVMEYMVGADVTLNSFIERTRTAPWGIDGGGDAAPNRISVRTAEGRATAFANGKVDGHRVGPGDRVVVETGGGGGWGDPRQRPREDVLADVRAGYVSAAAAHAHYGTDTERHTDTERDTSTDTDVDGGLS